MVPFTNGQQTGVLTTVGETWTFTCDTGYSRSGPATITCGSNGQWLDIVLQSSEYFICLFLIRI